MIGQSALRDSELQLLLSQVKAAVAAGELAQARRFADAACRRAPQSAEVLQLCGKLLFRCGEAEQALEVFERAAKLQSRADLEADRIRALLALGRRKAARGRLWTALSAFAVDAGDTLALTAREYIRSSRGRAAWVGISSTLEIWGEIAGGAQPHRIEIRLGDEIVGKAQVLPDTAGFGASCFRWRPPPDLAPGNLVVSVGDGDALKGGLAFPPDIGLDGRARFSSGCVEGWISSSWAPACPPELIAIDPLGREAKIALTPDPEEADRRAFSFDPKRLGLEGSPLALTAVTHDGRRLPLPGGPVLTSLPDPPAPAARTRPERGSSDHRLTDVVIPVYRGLEETLACIQSVIQTVGDGVELIVIDDASPEPQLRDALQAFADTGAVTLLRNPANLGFPATVNRGLALHPDRDVVILNADAEVYVGWLERLRAAAYSDVDIGTVTPLSNCGSIASYPAKDNSPCASDAAAARATITAEVNEGVRVEAPTGVGFCLYIRRDCLSETGPFDTACFEKGYGEENDFCVRAGRLGWRHLLAADVFVRHAGSRSFGDSRKALQERNSQILSWRYPDYDERVQAFVASDPLRVSRRRIDQKRLELLDRRFVLIATLDLPGGVDRLVRDRCKGLREQGLTPLILRPDPRRTGVSLGVDDEDALDLNYRLPCETQDALAFLRRLNIASIEFHHFLGLDPGFLDRLLDFGLPYEVFLHDYAWVCPRLSLLGGDGTYCGEPEISSCETCVGAHGSSLGEAITVRELRVRSGRWLSGARRVIAPSRDLQQRLQRYFPGPQIEVVPWEDDPTPQPGGKRGPGDVVKVAVVGAVGEQKGYQVLLACARDAAERRLPLEFVLIGYTEDDRPLIDTGKVFVTGRYREEEIDALLVRETPDLAFVPSVTPETWCFTLTHLLRAQIEVTAFDLGAVAERLRAAGGRHRLFPLGASAAMLNDHFLHAASGSTSDIKDIVKYRVDHDQCIENVLNLNQDSIDRREASIKTMITKHPMAHRADDQSAQGGFAASVEVLTLEQGVYLFSVTSAEPRRMLDHGDIMLPAVHIGPAPGIASGQVEIVEGLKAEGPWLYRPQDMLVLKVKIGPARLLLTSVRTTGMGALHVAVERLDRREHASQAAMSAPRTERLAPPQEINALQAAPSALPPGGLRTEISLHLRHRGDTHYRDVLWAKASDERLPIEAFSITPLEGLTPAQLEYKGLSADGQETPWIAGGQACGTRGRAMPLIGFAVRVCVEQAERFECEYRGMFRSGAVVGPLSDGAPCQAPSADDWLEGVQVFLKRRAAHANPSEDGAPGKMAQHHQALAARPIGPRFSVFREDA